jgi:SAM-dependent methyltransferase
MLIPLLVIFIILLLLYIFYNILITKYFRIKNSDCISYNFLKTFINNVSEGNNFMNYGLWNNDTKTLIEANQNLVSFIFNKSELTNKQNMNILDVGCGYGQQDIEWYKHLDKSCILKAFDISEEQIKHAITKNSNILFEVCDVKNIYDKYNNELFDVIFSLESAFHYPNRDKFFNDVNKLLTNNGKFIITDIMLKNDYNDNNIINKLFIRFFSDFLYIPEQNLISSEKWISQLDSNLIIDEIIDITDKTFNPYYIHFLNTYVKNQKLPHIIENILTNIFCSIQPFAYKIVICKKKETI